MKPVFRFPKQFGFEVPEKELVELSRGLAPSTPLAFASAAPPDVMPQAVAKAMAALSVRNQSVPSVSLPAMLFEAPGRK